MTYFVVFANFQNFFISLNYKHRIFSTIKIIYSIFNINLNVKYFLQFHFSFNLSISKININFRNLIFIIFNLLKTKLKIEFNFLFLINSLNKCDEMFNFFYLIKAIISYWITIKDLQFKNYFIFNFLKSNIDYSFYF